MVFAILYGFFCGCFLSLISAVAAKLYGADRLAGLSGLLLLFNAPGTSLKFAFPSLYLLPCTLLPTPYFPHILTSRIRLRPNYPPLHCALTLISAEKHDADHRISSPCPFIICLRCVLQAMQRGRPSGARSSARRATAGASSPRTRAPSRSSARSVCCTVSSLLFAGTLCLCLYPPDIVCVRA